MGSSAQTGTGWAGNGVQSWISTQCIGNYGGLICYCALCISVVSSITYRETYVQTQVTPTADLQVKIAFTFGRSSQDLFHIGSSSRATLPHKDLAKFKGTSKVKAIPFISNRSHSLPQQFSSYCWCFSKHGHTCIRSQPQCQLRHFSCPWRHFPAPQMFSEQTSSLLLPHTQFIFFINTSYPQQLHASNNLTSEYQKRNQI